jgi:DNA-binding response OmpR family regulator
MQQRIFRALIVDDEEAIRESVARAMATRSFWCETAADGYEALQKYRQSRHDLVVTDLRMPRMHGYALTLELLKDAQPPHIVVLTGVAEPMLVKDLLSRGVDDVINKPIDARVLATKMASIFERHVWRDEMVAANRNYYAGAGHTLIAKIESSLELLSLCVSDSLDELFQQAHEQLAEPPQAMLNFLERNFEDPGAGGERRTSDRVSLLATVVAVPVTRQFEPSGEPFKAAARDVSQGGMSMLHTRAVSSEYVALRWQSLASKNSFIKVAMKLCRCRPMGPFYEVAGEFVMRD